MNLKHCITIITFLFRFMALFCYQFRYFTFSLHWFDLSLQHTILTSTNNIWQTGHNFPPKAVLPCPYPGRGNRIRILWLSFSRTEPVCHLVSAAGRVWRAHRGHRVSHYPDDSVMVVWLDFFWNDMPLSRSVWLVFISDLVNFPPLRTAYFKSAAVTGWSLCKDFVFGPVTLCLCWWWLGELCVSVCCGRGLDGGAHCAPTISVPVSEMRPDTVPSLLPPGASHVRPSAGLLSRRPCCEEGCWVCSLLEVEVCRGGNVPHHPGRVTRGQRSL